MPSDFIPKNICRFNQIRYLKRPLFGVESRKNDAIGYATLIAPVISSKIKTQDVYLFTVHSRGTALYGESALLHP